MREKMACLGVVLLMLPGCSAAVAQVIDSGTGTVAVGGLFIQAVRNGDSTGSQEVAICEGWFPAQPSHALVVQDSLSMTITAQGSDGPALVWVLCGQSNFCGQPAGNASVLSRFWTRGECQVYVGTPDEGDQVTYDLQFTRL